jgi:hypothetical protein
VLAAHWPTCVLRGVVLDVPGLDDLAIADTVHVYVCEASRLAGRSSAEELAVVHANQEAVLEGTAGEQSETLRSFARRRLSASHGMPRHALASDPGLDLQRAPRSRDTD